MFRPTHAVVDLKRLRANTRALLKMANGGFFCPMVKANAYGHGDVEVTNALIQENVKRVGVVLVEEGLRLRERGVEAEILVFSRLESGAKALVDARLTPVLSDWDDLRRLADLSSKDPIAIHIKLDTGMHRMGFSIEEVAKLRRFFATERRLRCVGICSHLSHGADAALPNGVSEAQIVRFRQACQDFGDDRVLRHLLNSEALWARTSAGLDCSWLGARPGLAIYGLSFGVDPVMSLLTQLDLVRKVAKGESVSYGGRWTASIESWIGIVPLGYGDGYWRGFSNRASMLFRGKRVPVVGTVCMDYCLLDLTAACQEGEPKKGEDIVVFGRQAGAEVTVRELTDLAGTIPYELVTGLSKRVPRVYT